MAARPSSGDFVLSTSLKREGRWTDYSSIKIWVFIEVKNASMRKLLSSKTCVVQFDGDDHFLATKEYVNGASQVLLTLKTHVDSSIDNLSNVYFRLEEGGQVLAKQGVYLGVADFTADFFRDDYEQDVRNILLFGVIGAGKSSFINAVYRMLSGTKHEETATTGGSENTVTTEFRGYRAADLEKKDPARFRIYDTWGLEPDNVYEQGEFEMMLDGKLENQFQMHKRLPFAAEANPKQDIHCVIFCIHAPEVDTESEFMKRVAQFVEVATRKRTSCIVIVTKCDLIDSSFPLKDSSKIPQAVEDKLLEVASILRIPRNRVFPMVSTIKDTNTNSQFSDPPIDRLVFTAIKQALRIGDAYAARTAIMSDKRFGGKSIIDL